MRISVIRDQARGACTESLVLVDGEFFCYGLEPPKHPNTSTGNGRVCIPTGDYTLVQHESALGASHWNEPVMPMVSPVPGRDFVLVHPGNFPKDTEGCLIVGEKRSDAYVGPSVPIWRELFAKIKAAWAVSETVKIEYRETKE
ncbi:MAG: DUF5675 family protein [Acidobacteriota bacterium]